MTEVSQTLANGAKITQHTTGNGRYYTIDEDPERYISATSANGIVAKPFLVAWASKLAAEQVASQTEMQLNARYVFSPIQEPETASPQSLLHIAAREWFRRGFEESEVGPEIVRLNTKFAEPMTNRQVNTIIKHAKKLASAESYRGMREGMAGLAQHAKNEHKRVAEESGDLGTRVHEWIDHLLRTGEVVTPDDDMALAVHAFQEWYGHQTIGTFKESECMLYHHYGFAGTCDAVFDTPDGGIALVDWKTSKSIYPEYALQLGAYAMCYENVHEENVGEAYVVRFDKEKGRAYQKKVNLEKAKTEFLARLRVYQGGKSEKDVWL